MDEAYELDQETIDRIDALDREILAERALEQISLGSDELGSSRPLADPRADQLVPLVEAASRLGVSCGSLRHYCEQGRIERAIKLPLEGKGLCWHVPQDLDETMIRDKRKAGRARLTEQHKNRIAIAYKTGEKSSGDLAIIFDIHPSYPSQLVRRGYPTQ